MMWLHPERAQEDYMSIIRMAICAYDRLTAEASRRDFAKLRDSEDWDILLPDQKRTIIAAAFGFP